MRSLKDSDIVIAALGGGTNSVAMIIECWKRGINIDLILFADPGGEIPWTYEYLQIFNKWLIDHNMPQIVIVRKVTKDGEVLTLEENCLQINSLPSIAYGFKKCSLKFKVAPQDKYVNNWGPAKDAWRRGEKVVKLIGYDAGEPHRVKDYNNDKYIYKYPLVEWDMWRSDCVETIQEAGLPLPGKSSCFFCPSMKKHEILELRKEHPDLLQRAIAMEKNANLTSIPGLGRNYAWWQFIEYTEMMEKEQANAKPGEIALGHGKYQCSMFVDANDDMPCGCYDG